MYAHNEMVGGKNDGFPIFLRVFYIILWNGKFFVHFFALREKKIDCKVTN